MNSPPPTASAPSLPAASRFLASAQLIVAVIGLACAMAHAIRVPVSYTGDWDDVPVPLVLAVSATVTVALIRRGRFSAATMAAILPLVAHLLKMLSDLRWTDISWSDWARFGLSIPLGQGSLDGTSLFADIAGWMSVAAIVLGAVAAVGLARAARRQERPSPASRLPLLAVAPIALLAIVSYWAGGLLSERPPLHGPWTEAVDVALVVLAAAAVAALIDAHTRWASRQGMPKVTAVSTDVSAGVLIVPAGWLLWPTISLMPQPPVTGGIGIGLTNYPSRLQSYADGLMALGMLLELVAVAAATLTAVHRASAARRPTVQTQA